jgi:hypothetical protein
MSFLFISGLLAAGTAETVFLGTLLLYLAGRYWKAPQASLLKALALCLALLATSVVTALAMFAVSRVKSESVTLVAAIVLAMTMLALQWQWAKSILHTNRMRALAIWISAWLPLTFANMALATVTKAIMVEAFKTPTGGMAPTIIGVHAVRECGNCSARFLVSLTSWQSLPRGAERQDLRTRCPNCKQPHTVGNETKLLEGDRFLLDKIARPERWSVVAFRKPPERKELYLQRLIGLPGETIEVAGGEIFINNKLLRKPPHVATDLWLPLHDTALTPKRVYPDTPRWRPDESSGWRESAGRWTVENAAEPRERLVFDGAITDFLACNGNDDSSEPQPENSLGDVLVTCEIGDFQGTGKAGFQWEFRGTTVRAETAADGSIVIEASVATSEGEVESARAVGHCARRISPGDSLAFAVRDGQGYVLVNGQLTALVPFGPETADAFRDLLTSDAPCRLAIDASHCSLTIDRITLQRDVYYLGSDAESGFGLAGRRAATGAALKLEEAECFFLGDNSARSLDSRFFGGALKSDIVGVGRCIYWPPNRWRDLR